MVRRRARPAKELLATTATATASASSSPQLLDVAAAAAIAGANLLDDQYFASPKRKDCRVEKIAESLEGNVTLAEHACGMEKPQKSQNKTKSSSSPGKIKSERGGISGRTIGVPLATRSQTKTIENFFRAKAAAKSAKISVSENASERQASSPNSLTMPVTSLEMLTAEALLSLPIEFIDENPQQAQQQLDLKYFGFNSNTGEDAEDSNDTDRTSYSNEANNPIGEGDGDAICISDGLLVDFETHRSTLRYSNSSHSSTATTATENIFLQEPVLTLDVDKSPNQASSIKINKSIEVGAIFSSPPSFSSCALNGRFNQIVTLNNNSPTKRNSFGNEIQNMPLSTNSNNNNNNINSCGSISGFTIPPRDNDSSSCDSGVASSGKSHLLATLNNQIGSPTPTGDMEHQQHEHQQTRHRKPATPHRILCPSPIKTMPRHDVIVSGAVIGAVGGVGIIGTKTTGGLQSCARKVAAAFKDQLSPRKSQRQLTAATCKSRRRLNQPKEQAPYTTPMASNDNAQAIDVVHVIDDDNEDVNNDDDDDDDDDVSEEFENNVGNCDDDVVFLGAPPLAQTKYTARLNANNAKSILNSAKHPTARQNTTNNKYQATKTNTKGHGAKSKAASSSSTASSVSSSSRSATLKTQHPIPLAATNGNRELTDYFPVRRSVRKTKTAVKEEMMRNLEQAILDERCEGLKVKNFEGKGRGIIADQRFQRGQFVIEYVGDLISMTEAAEREKRYALDENAGCYMYYFKHKNQQYCIDATIDTGKYGRLVNHSRNGNLITKVVVVKQRPHLVLLAKDDIEQGEELCYDYGDRSKESLLHHPWLAF